MGLSLLGGNSVEKREETRWFEGRGGGTICEILSIGRNTKKFAMLCNVSKGRGGGGKMTLLCPSATSEVNEMYV